MDTRTKIVSPQQALRLAQGGATVVSGYFDPLLAAHAQRLQQVKGGAPLLVLIADPPAPVLASRARAELVAALACVDYVAEWTPDITPQLRLEQEDAERLDRLIEHVHQRQAAAS